MQPIVAKKIALKIAKSKQRKLVPAAFQKAFPAQLTDLGGQAAAVDLQIICQLLPVIGDGEGGAALELGLVQQVSHQLFPGASPGGNLDLLIEDDVFHGHQLQQIEDDLTGLAAVKGVCLFDTTALEEENATLRRKLAELEAEIRQARLDSAENARLKELLGLQEKRPDLTSDLEAATVTEHAVTNWSSTLTISKGTSSGLEIGDCVIDETGALVGLIHDAGTNWATILTVVDTDTSLGAQVFRTGDLCLAQGNFSLMGENRLRLEYLPADTQLLGGDLVVTSGLGGYYPAGLVIGSVEKMQTDSSGADSYAVLIPAVEFGALEEVFIIRSFDPGS